MASTRISSLSIIALLSGALLLLLGGMWARDVLKNPVGETPEGGYALLRQSAAYKSSGNCQPCHRDHYDSWDKTHHSKMTQKADEDSILAPFTGEDLVAMGITSRARIIDGSYVIETTHPTRGTEETFPVVMTVGSRRIQQFVTKFDGNTPLRLPTVSEDFYNMHVRLPWAYTLEENRWIHLSEAFFHPDGEDFHTHTAYWDFNCIFCHNTEPNPGLERKLGRSQANAKVAELGISCESCHGPGEQHANRMRNPLRRYGFAMGSQQDPTIVDPNLLTQERSVQVCAHCHGQRLPAEQDRIMELYKEGDPYVAGDDLGKYFQPIQPDTTINLQQGHQEGAFAPRFWKDGSPRLSAYEYQGLMLSPCYTEGDMTCLSCHQMHDSNPKGQLKPELSRNDMCLQCHQELGGNNLGKHTRHQADSSGSDCMSCHMSEEIYGVLSWHPSHMIRSPDPSWSANHQKPDACTMCHTGQSLVWAEQQADLLWPDRTQADLLMGPEHQTPEMIRALFQGDVVYRTLAAHRLGKASPDSGVSAVAIPLLAQSLLDSYPNVRRTARLSLMQLTARRDIPLPHDPLTAREKMVRTLSGGSFVVPESGYWPFTENKQVDFELLQKWSDAREEIPFSIGE